MDIIFQDLISGFVVRILISMVIVAVLKTNRFFIAPWWVGVLGILHYSTTGSNTGVDSAAFATGFFLLEVLKLFGLATHMKQKQKKEA